MSVAVFVKMAGKNEDRLNCEEVKYSPEVRMGNWYEDLFRKNEIKRDFLRKKANLALVSQKIDALFGSYLSPMVLTGPCTILRNEAIFQIATQSLSLSLGPLEANWEFDTTPVTTLSKCEPCKRNCFKLKMNSRFLCYGDSFHLELASEEGKFLAPKTQSVCPTNGKTYNELEVVDCTSKFTVWTVLHLNPDKRLETLSKEIPVNQPVLIQHPLTNRFLTKIDKSLQTIFGSEIQVVIANFGKNTQTWEMKLKDNLD